MVNKICKINQQPSVNVSNVQQRQWKLTIYIKKKEKKKKVELCVYCIFFARKIIILRNNTNILKGIYIFMYHGLRARLYKLQKGCTRLAVTSAKVYQLLAHGRWFSLGTPASSITKTGRHDIAEILLKVALKTKIQNSYIFMYRGPVHEITPELWPYYVRQYTWRTNIYAEFYLGFENTRIANERHHISIVNCFLKWTVYTRSRS